MGKDKITIEIVGKGLDKAQKELDSVKKSMEKTSKQAKTTSIDFKNSWLIAVAAVTAAIAGLKKAFDFAKEGARIQQSMQATANQFGISVDKMVKKLRDATAGTVNDFDLISAANRAMALNVTTDMDEMSQLFEVARARAKAMGISTTQAVNDIATGIGRASPLILDNLGIITKGWADEAKAAGKAFDAQFILNKVLEDGADIVERSNPGVLTMAERFDKMQTNVANLSNSFKRALSAEILAAVDRLSGDGKGFGKLANKISAVRRGMRVFFVLITIFLRNTQALLKVVISAFTPLIVAIDTVRRAIKFIKSDSELSFDALKNGLKDSLKLTKELALLGPKAYVDAWRNIGTDLMSIFEEIDNLEVEASEERKNRAKETADAIIAEEKRIATVKARAIEAALDVFTKSSIEERNTAKETAKQVLRSVVNSIANELQAKMTASLVAAFLLPPGFRGAQIAKATAGLAAVSSVRALANSGINEFAQGTDFSPSGAALVGERGPEIVNLPQGAQVVPNQNITNNTNDNKSISIQVNANDPITLVNELRQTYGLDVFGEA